MRDVGARAGDVTLHLIDTWQRGTPSLRAGKITFRPLLQHLDLENKRYMEDMTKIKASKQNLRSLEGENPETSLS